MDVAREFMRPLTIALSGRRGAERRGHPAAALTGAPLERMVMRHHAHRVILLSRRLPPSRGVLVCEARLRHFSQTLCKSPKQSWIEDQRPSGSRPLELSASALQDQNALV